MSKNHTKIIAELGNIHLHNIDNCRIAVRDAFTAGADLVKLQVINPLTAYWSSKEQFERYKSIAWSIDVHRDFYEEMNAIYDNRVFASVFDADYVKQLQDVMPLWKVAFRMRDDKQLVSNMIWTGKPIIFSTRSKVYLEDYDRYFTRSDKFKILYATEYEYKRNLEQNIKQAFAAGKYAGVSINFGGKQCTTLAKYVANECEYIEVHAQGIGAIGSDSEWSLHLNTLEKLRLEID